MKLPISFNYAADSYQDASGEYLTRTEVLRGLNAPRPEERAPGGCHVCSGLPLKGGCTLSNCPYKPEAEIALLRRLLGDAMGRIRELEHSSPQKTP